MAKKYEPINTARLISEAAKRAGEKRIFVEKDILAFLDVLKEHLSQEGVVILTGIGKFEVVIKPSVEVSIPNKKHGQAGEPPKIPVMSVEKRVVTFRASSKLGDNE